MTPCSPRLVVLLLALACAPAPALAFTLESPISEGCHERISLAALAAAGGAPPANLEADEVLAAALPSQAADPWTLALLAGVRDPDLRGVATTDLLDLAEVHADAAGQAAHCLRAPGDDGDDGDAAALRACRALILAEVAAAMGPGERPDPAARETVPLWVPFRGTLDVAVPAHAFHLGRALHALQDSFTHSLRSRDGRSVYQVLNYAEPLRGGYEPGRDGRGHLSRFDRCDGSDGAARRVEPATAASTALLAAVLGGDGRDRRLGAAAAVLDEQLAYDAACGRDADLCGAAAEMDAGCSMAGRGDPAGVIVALGAALLLLLLRRAGRAVAVLRRRAAAGLGALALVLLAAPAARAAESPVGLQAALGASVDGGALAGRLGGRWRVSPRVSLGLAVEHNPWFSIGAGRVAPGALNAYGTLVVVLRRLPRLDLRLTAHAGASVLLFDTAAASAGSVGPFAGASLLGVSVPVGRGVRLTIDPMEIALAVPQLSGVPLLYKQYRFMVGIDWFPGLG